MLTSLFSVDDFKVASPRPDLSSLSRHFTIKGVLRENFTSHCTPYPLDLHLRYGIQYISRFTHYSRRSFIRHSFYLPGSGHLPPHPYIYCFRSFFFHTLPKFTPCIHMLASPKQRSLSCIKFEMFLCHWFAILSKFSLRYHDSSFYIISCHAFVRDYIFKGKNLFVVFFSFTLASL